MKKKELKKKKEKKQTKTNKQKEETSDDSNHPVNQSSQRRMWDREIILSILINFAIYRTT